MEIITKRYGINYNAVEGQTVEVIINEGRFVQTIASGLTFDNAQKICRAMDETEGIGQNMRYRYNGAEGFMYIGTTGNIQQFHNGRAVFRSDSGAVEILPMRALDRLEEQSIKA